MDLVPRIIPADEWEHIEAGLVQRVTALNRFLDDLYVGERAAIKDGIVPQWLVDSQRRASSARRSASRCRTGARCLVAGIDLVRDGDGHLPGARGQPAQPERHLLRAREPRRHDAGAAHAVRRPARPPGRPLRRRRCSTALRHVAPPAAGDPTVVVLTPGVFNSRVLRARVPRSPDGRRARRGPRPRRRRARGVDAHHARPRARRRDLPPHRRRVPRPGAVPAPTRCSACPGCMAAARAGNVTIANAIGNGVADDKAVYAYVPDLIRYYLDEEPILPNVDTYLLWDADQRSMCVERLDELVVKPVSASGGYGMFIGPAASRRRDRAMPQAHRRRPSRLHRPGGRAAVAPPDARRRSPRGTPHRPAPVRAVGRAGRRHPSVTAAPPRSGCSPIPIARSICSGKPQRDQQSKDLAITGATLFVHLTGDDLRRTAGDGETTPGRRREARHRHPRPPQDLAPTVLRHHPQTGPRHGHGRRCGRPARPTAWMREHVILRDGHCVFPGCDGDARRCDLDHIDPYVPIDEGGPPGQTNPATSHACAGDTTGSRPSPAGPTNAPATAPTPGPAHTASPTHHIRHPSTERLSACSRSAGYRSGRPAGTFGSADWLALSVGRLAVKTPEERGFDGDGQMQRSRPPSGPVRNPWTAPGGMKTKVPGPIPSAGSVSV